MEIFRINTKKADRQVIINEMPDELSLSMRATQIDSQANTGISLNEKITMCSSMIGYCHYLEAASGQIGFH